MKDSDKSINKQVENYSNKIKNIKLENLTFNYGARNNSLLENVNLVIEENELGTSSSNILS